MNFVIFPLFIRSPLRDFAYFAVSRHFPYQGTAKYLQWKTEGSLNSESVLKQENDKIPCDAKNVTLYFILRVRLHTVSAIQCGPRLANGFLLHQFSHLE